MVLRARMFARKVFLMILVVLELKSFTGMTLLQIIRQIVPFQLERRFCLEINELPCFSFSSQHSGVNFRWILFCFHGSK